MKNIQKERILITTVVGVTLLALGFYYIPHGSGYLSTLSEVYLNANDQEKSPSGKISMTDGSSVVRSGSHSAVKFTTTDDFAPVLFEQNRGLLDPSKCPNVFSQDELDSDGCHSVGSILGSTVYAVSRNIDQTGFDSYLILGKTFIAIHFIDGPESLTLPYISGLKRVSNSLVSSILVANKRQVYEYNSSH